MQSHKATRAMVLAAGVGSRLDPLTSQVPKPLVPVLNVPVIEHIFKLLAKHGITDVCANLHYLSEQIIAYCGNGERFGINLTLKPEPKLSGDAGGVRFCREFLEGGTFMVIMGDLLTDADLTSIINTHKSKKALASIAVKAVPNEEVSSFGVVVRNEEGFITGFQEKPKPEEALSNMISTGIYIFEPEVFNYIPKEGDFGFRPSTLSSTRQRRAAGAWYRDHELLVRRGFDSAISRIQLRRVARARRCRQTGYAHGN